MMLQRGSERGGEMIRCRRGRDSLSTRSRGSEREGEMIRCRRGRDSLSTRSRERERRLCRRRGRERERESRDCVVTCRRGREREEMAPSPVDEATAQRGEIRARVGCPKIPNLANIYSGSGVRVGLVFSPIQFFWMADIAAIF